MDIPRVAALTPTRAVEPSRPVAEDRRDAASAPQALGPAVTLDVPSGALATPTRERVTLDDQIRAPVFQVVEGGSGTVIVQVPDERAIRARIYAREVAERAEREPPTPLAVA